MLERFLILVTNPVRLGHFILEHGRKALNGDAVLARGCAARAAPCDRVAGQRGALALQQVGQGNAKRQGALVDKGKRQIDRARFIVQIHFRHNVGLSGHLVHRIAENAAQFADALRHLQQFSGRRRLFHQKIPP